MTNKRTISVQRNSEKKRKCHYFREVGNTVASVSTVFLFNLYNNAVNNRVTNNGVNQMLRYACDYN